MSRHIKSLLISAGELSEKISIGDETLPEGTVVYDIIQNGLVYEVYDADDRSICTVPVAVAVAFYGYE